MGRAATAKRHRRQERMRSGTGEIEVVCPGMLEILSVGKGDIKLTIDPSKPKDVESARTMIEEMLAKGYTIFVENPKNKSGLSRVKRFDPKKMVYIISEVVEPTPTKPAKRTRDRQVPVAGSKAKAIGRTAGG